MTMNVNEHMHTVHGMKCYTTTLSHYLFYKGVIIMTMSRSTQLHQDEYNNLEVELFYL